jgi:hypothetical protein
MRAPAMSLLSRIPDASLFGALVEQTALPDRIAIQNLRPRWAHEFENPMGEVNEGPETSEITVATADPASIRHREKFGWALRVRHAL